MLLKTFFEYKEPCLKRILFYFPFYHNRFAYDGNGNILSQVRRGGRQGSLGLDSLSYNYQVDNNRLDYVADGIADGEYANDIDNQTSGNYVYDPLGNLIYDRAEGIDTIDWNLYGKVSRIVRNSASARPNLYFNYSPDGQRIIKRVQGADTTTQLYVRDASGNIMAVYSYTTAKPIKILDTGYMEVISRLITQVGLEDYSEFIVDQMRSDETWRERLMERIPLFMDFSQDSIKQCLGNYLIAHQTGCSGCSDDGLRDDLFDVGTHSNSCPNYTYLVTTRLMGENYLTWPGSGSWTPIGVSFNLAHDAGLERMRVTASSSVSGSLAHPFTVSTLSTMNIEFDIEVESGYDDISIVINDGGTPIHSVGVISGTGPYHFSYSFTPSNSSVSLALHNIVLLNQVDYTVDNFRITQDNTGTTPSCIDIAATPGALADLYTAMYNCNPEKLLLAYLSQPGFNQDLLLDLESFINTNYSHANLLTDMQTYFEQKYLGVATPEVFLAQTVNKPDILHYLNTYHYSYGINALAQVIENDYVKYLYQVVQDGYDNCEFYSCVSACESGWASANTTFGNCNTTLTSAMSTLPQDDELINANLYYCYSDDYDNKIHPNLLALFTNSHIVTGNPDAFEEAITAYPYRNLVMKMHGSGGNSSLFSALADCNQEKLIETILRLYPREFLTLLESYVSMDVLLSAFSISPKFDEMTSVMAHISPLPLATYLESNYPTEAGNALSDFASYYNLLLTQVSYQAFTECDFKDCVLANWTTLGIDSGLIYDFIREHHWVNALKNIYLTQEDEFNKQFSYLYPTMLADVLENYTPEDRYSMSTFLDAVEAYFGTTVRDYVAKDSTVYRTHLILNEHHLYGSSRLGLTQPNDTFRTVTYSHVFDVLQPTTIQGIQGTFTDHFAFDSLFVHQRGRKIYEGTNHLGNVLVTFSDKRISVCDEELDIAYFKADVLSAVDYYPFHSIIPDRQWYAGNDSSAYRFGGSNGQEKDDEIYGVGNSYTAEYWQYDPRLGRRWNVDPVSKIDLSSYLCFRGNPMLYIDPNGDDDFFDAKGKFLGSTTEGNKIRVVNEGMTFDQVKADIPNTSKLITDISYKPEETANRTMLSVIATYYAMEGGVPKGYVVEISSGSNDKKGPLAAYNIRDDKFKIIVYDDGTINNHANDKFNLVNSFVHEKHHKDDKKTKENLHHVDAIIVQADHSSFENTTPEFKQAAISYAGLLLNNAIGDNASPNEVHDKINQLNNSRLGEYGFFEFKDNQVEYTFILNSPIIRSEPPDKK